ncbi:single-stranded DNA-binding protein [Neisseria mucosa]|jgi:single-strand binding protein|uniref:single-stranded DNA-binding protein n=1 Tax=Neisseria mucosa TaxID=488 RepID=UPI0027DF2424|nr:single-stranded DNA-binding protein [Neisseria mucosa]
MPYVNKIEIMGNLGKDPELRYLSDGKAATKIQVAVSEKWTDKATGAQKEHVEWVPVLLYERLAETVCRHMKSGDTILVYGKIRTRPYTGRDGIERHITEVIASEMQIIRTREAQDAAVSDGVHDMMR